MEEDRALHMKPTHSSPCPECVCVPFPLLACLVDVFHLSMSALGRKHSSSRSSQVLPSTMHFEYTEEYTEYTELYKKDLHDPDNHNAVITDLESDQIITMV